MRIPYSLFPQSIPRVGPLVDLGLFLPNSTNCATAVCTPDGREWVRKKETDSGLQELLAEGVAWLFAKILGISMPEAAVNLSSPPEGSSWLSERVDAVVAWNPASADHLLNPGEVGAMLTLDLILHNQDRHDGNLLLQPALDDLHLRALAIDFGNSLVGYPTNLDQAGLAVPSVDRHLRGLPLPLLQEGALTAARTAADLSVQEIGALVDDPCSIVGYGSTLQGTMVQALHRRCQAAPTLLPIYLQRLEERDEQ